MTTPGTLPALLVGNVPAWQRYVGAVTLPSALSGAGTLTATIKVGVAPIQFAGEGTLALTTKQVYTRTAALAGDGALSATAVPCYVEPTALTGSGSLAAGWSQKFAATGALTGGGTLSATVTGQTQPAPAFNGAGTLSATVTQIYTQPGPFTGNGVLGSNVNGSAAVPGDFTGAGTLAGVPSQVYSQAVALAGAGSLTAVSTQKFAQAAALTGDGALAAAVAPIQYPTLSGDGALSATALQTAFEAPAFAGEGTLAGPLQQLYAAAAALTGVGALAGAGFAQYNTAPAFLSTGQLSATAHPFNVTYDATGVGYTGTGTPGWAHSVGAGAKAIVVSGTFWVNAATMPAMTVKIGSTTIPLQGNSAPVYTTGGYYMYLPVFALLGTLPTGSQTLTITGTSGYAVAFNSISYNNVVEFGPVVTVDNTAGATAQSISVASAVGQMVFNAFGAYTDAYSAYTQTQRWLANWVSGVNLSTVMGDAPGAPTVTFGVTCAAADAYGAVAMVLVPAIPVIPVSAAFSGGGALTATGYNPLFPAYLGGSTIAQGSTTFTETIPVGTTLAVLWTTCFSQLAGVSATIGSTPMVQQIGLNVWQFQTEWYWAGCLVLQNPPTGPQIFTLTSSANYGVLGWSVTAYYINAAGVGAGTGTTQGATALADSVASSVLNALYAQYFMTGVNATSGSISGYNQTQRSPAAAAIGAGAAFPAMSGDAYGNGGTLNFAATALGGIGNGAGSLILPIYAPVPVTALFKGTGILSGAPPLTLTGSASVAGTSITLPAHNVGDLIVIYAFNNAANTTPTKPAASGTVPAWVDIDNNAGANTCASRTAYFRATATNHTSGTWTGATGMAAAVISSTISSTMPIAIGNHAEAGSTGSNTTVAPATTPAIVDSTSLLLEFFGHRTVTAWGAAPTGYTQRTSAPTSVCFDTKNNTITDGSVTQPATTSSSAGYRGAVVEVISAEPNTARTNQPVPPGVNGCYVTLYGAGGGGGQGQTNGGLGSYGGNGAGGGGRVGPVFIPAASLGSTYSVTVGAGGTDSAGGNGTNGGSSTFTSGGISLSAGGGLGGGAYGGGAGTGGVCSATGITPAMYPGTNGGGGSTTGGAAASDTVNDVGCGGGGGGGNSFGVLPGGAGGSSNTVTGGASDTQPPDAPLIHGGAGGGGGTGTYPGKAGGKYGGGGGGGGGQTSGAGALGGNGGAGGTLIQWV